MRKLDPEAVIERVAGRIAEMRIERGMTQAQMADKLRIPMRGYQRIESGTQNLTIAMIVRIANALDVADPQTLFDKPAPRTRARGRPKRAPS